jgi:hypothetical protein
MLSTQHSASPAEWAVLDLPLDCDPEHPIPPERSPPRSAASLVPPMPWTPSKLLGSSSGLAGWCASPHRPGQEVARCYG